MIVFLFIFYAYHSLQQDYIGCVFINILRNNDEKRGANQKIPLASHPAGPAIQYPNTILKVHNTIHYIDFLF